VSSPAWRVERLTGSAAAFHGLDLLADASRAAWLFEVDRPALVLGSAQSPSVVRSDPSIDVVRRRSGGGAVLLLPGEALWVDVVIPRDDPLWQEDIGRAPIWLGDAWAAAVGSRAEVHRGPMVRSAWSSLVCFAGLGPGEVTIRDAKVVGISQRRTRAGARFQCVVHRRFDAEATVALLAEPRPAPADLVVGTVELPLEELAERFLAALRSRSPR
jgi:lipoate-protein ligase A